jgi:hypothetical protein
MPKPEPELELELPASRLLDKIARLPSLEAGDHLYLLI